MDLQHLSIGQMAKLNHISEQTLRLYDKMNLLKPISVNQEIHERLNAMNLNTMPAILQSRYDYIKKEILQGRTKSSLARELGVSWKTLDRHLCRIMFKN